MSLLRKNKIRYKPENYLKTIVIILTVFSSTIKSVNSTRNNMITFSLNGNSVIGSTSSSSTSSSSSSSSSISSTNNNIQSPLYDGNSHTNSIQQTQQQQQQIRHQRQQNRNIDTSNYSIFSGNSNIHDDLNLSSPPQLSASNVIDSSMNNNNNNIMICQTVCACKWKGGKQTVECIDRSLIRIPENIDPTTQVLDMSGNNLQNLANEQFLRSNLLNLQKLYLRNCKIGEIQPETFKGLTNLVELDLSHNLLVVVPSQALSHIPSLRDLTLASNHIHKIDGHSFRNTPSLHKLDLSHCDIQTIAPQAFEGLDSLLSLKLNGNKLSELRPKTIETLSRLHGIELHDNPWMCDCRLRAAKLWLTEKNIPYPVAPICSGGPERIIDRSFTDLQIDEFACRPEMLPVDRYVEAIMGDNATIICRSSAIPSALINWYWNGRLLLNGSTFSSYQRLYIYEDGQFEKKSHLVLTNAQETDSSEFYCVAENRAGAAEANFTLHVSMRAAGMASLGSGQIVGLSAALVILILFILLISLYMLVRYKRQPFVESKTPNHLEVITSVNHQNNITTKIQPSQNNGNIGGMVVVNGGIVNNCIDNSLEHKIIGSVGNCNSGVINNNESKLTNPVQKPPRLTDLAYSNSNYDGNNSSAFNAQSCFISPTASAGNNPDLINDTKRFGSGEFADLKIPIVLQQGNLLDSSIERPGSGEYSRANGCDSLYPSGLWETGTSNGITSNNTDDSYLKRAASTTIPGYTNYTDKTPIIDNNQMYDLHERTTEYFSRTFPRTHYQQQMSSSVTNNGASTSSGLTGSTVTTTTILGGTDNSLTGSGSSNIGGVGNSGVVGYPSDYGLPLVPGAEQQQQHQHHHHQLHPLKQQKFNHNIINNNNSSSSNSINSNSSSSNSNNKNNGNGILGSGSSSNNGMTPTMLPNGMPVNAKTIRVWQKGGVPVLPPVTALKRALISSSRNSPDEGYQEGCGTDV